MPYISSGQAGLKAEEGVRRTSVKRRLKNVSGSVVKRRKKADVKNDVECGKVRPFINLKNLGNVGKVESSVTRGPGFESY